MALTIYDAAAKEHAAALEEIDRYMAFVSAAGHVRPWVGSLIDRSMLEQHQVTGLTRFISQKDYQLEVGYGGLLIGIGAAFEHFVRRIIKEGVQWINKKIDKFEKLPESLRQQNWIRSGHALVTVAEPPVEFIFDYEEISHNLSGCRKGGGALILNAEAFSINITNINQKRIDESLNRIGIKLDWDVFGGNKDLQKLFQTKGARDTRDEVQKYLKKFVVQRNRIAHSGIGVRVVQLDLDTALAFFKAFGLQLGEAVEAALKKTYK